MKHDTTDDASRARETAVGREGDAAKAGRTIRAEMTDDMRFSPAEIIVKRVETVPLVAANKGQVLHELVLGTPDGLSRHARMMKELPGLQHDGAHMAHVRPGRKGEIVWQFTRPGEFRFACLIPGHSEAGMVGKVIVK